MNSKRERSNAKANIWDINVDSKDFIKFVLTMMNSKSILSIKNDDHDDYDVEEMSKLVSSFNSKRRNAIGDIWSIVDE